MAPFLFVFDDDFDAQTEESLPISTNETTTSATVETSQQTLDLCQRY